MPFMLREVTIVKSQPVQSAEIADSQNKFEFAPKSEMEPLLANWVEDNDEHWKVELETPHNGRYDWYLFKHHVQIVKGYEDDESVPGDIEESSMEEQSKSGRWDKALAVCPTEGCKPATATPEGLSTAGVSASHEIARKDMVNLNQERLASLEKAGQKLNVPTAIIAALASREKSSGGDFREIWQSTGLGRQ